MKEESVLNVLMYLFKHHMHDGITINDAHSELVDQLEDAGFHRQAISFAFEWLKQLSELSSVERPKQTGALRIYHEEETDILDTECRGFIHLLEQSDILKPYTREMVINQALALQEDIDIALIKWVTLMVLFAQPNEKNALAYMESLVFNDPVGLTH